MAGEPLAEPRISICVYNRYKNELWPEGITREGKPYGDKSRRMPFEEGERIIAMTFEEYAKLVNPDGTEKRETYARIPRSVRREEELLITAE